MEIRVEIGTTGDQKWFALNTREDLLQDYNYFIEQAKTLVGLDGENQLLQKRFLRAALLIVFAYAEAVTNTWLHEVLANRNVLWLFKSVERARLEDKMRLLHEAISAATCVPDVKDAREVRNLLVHFKPGNDGDAFDRLSLEMVEKTFAEVDDWIRQMEKALNTVRHADSKEELEKITAEMAQYGVVANPTT